DFILHQDSAPSHVSKFTLSFLNERKVNYISPNVWTPTSPGNAPMDNFAWGYMEEQLKHRKSKTIGFQRHFNEIWKNITQ
ncbi:uncharacterized protein B4U79_15964, partial [Dinothrombium tinctorium]